MLNGRQVAGLLTLWVGSFLILVSLVVSMVTKDYSWLAAMIPGLPMILLGVICCSSWRWDDHRKN